MPKPDPEARSTAGAWAMIVACILPFPVMAWAATGFALPPLPDLPDWPMLAWLGLMIWLGLGILTAWLASQRGRSAPVWLAIGLLLGPFALLAVGLAPVRDRD